MNDVLTSLLDPWHAPIWMDKGALAKGPHVASGKEPVTCHERRAPTSCLRAKDIGVKCVTAHDNTGWFDTCKRGLNHLKYLRKRLAEETDILDAAVR